MPQYGLTKQGTTPHAYTHTQINIKDKSNSQVHQSWCFYTNHITSPDVRSKTEPVLQKYFGYW